MQPLIDILDARVARAELARDLAVKSAEFQRRRADRGWFLYESTLTQLIALTESRPVEYGSEWGADE